MFKLVDPALTDPISEAVLISLLGALIAILAGGLKENPFDPWNQIIIVWILLGVLHPLARNYSNEAYSRGQLGLSVTDSLPKASLIFALGCLATLAGVASGRRGNLPTGRNGLRSSTIELKKGWETILVSIWLLGTFLLIQRIGLSGLTQWRSRETQSTLISVSSYLWFTNYLLIVPALIRLLRKDRTKRDQILGLIMLYAPVGINILSGNRIFIIPIIILHFLIYSMKQKSLKLSTIFLLLLIVFIAISGLRNFRESADSYSSYNRLSFVEKQLTIFQGQDLAMLDNLSLLVKSDARNSDFPFIDYINIFTRPIPRQIWPTKPRTFDQKLNDLLLPSEFKAGYGFSFTFVGESFYQLGITGVLLVSYFFGVFLGICTKWTRNMGSSKLQIIGLISISLFIVFMRGSFSADAPRLIFSLLPVLLVSSTKTHERIVNSN